MRNGKLTKILEKTQDVSRKTLRDYIGASSIGSDCLRQIWYEFNNKKTSKINQRIKRIWGTGKILEKFLIDKLLEANVQLVLPDQCNHYLEFFDEKQQYFKGHCDALIIEQRQQFILEIKSAKHSSFTAFTKNGLKKWSPKYYAQVQAYMGMGKINGAYLLAINKDNSDLHDEFVSFDAQIYAALQEKARMIYEAKTMPPRINNSPAWYQCKMCKYSPICHK